MTKSEIVKEISARTGIDGKAVLAVVEGFMNEGKDFVGQGGKCLSSWIR